MKGLPRGQLALRRRNPWEAMDAGLALWRVNAAAVLLPAMLMFAGLAIVLRLILPDLPWIPWLLPFSLRPLVDHWVVHVLSVREFNPDARGKALRAGMGRTLFYGLAGDLLWRRLDWRRGTNIPLRLLEQVKGRALRARKKTLARGGSAWAGLNLVLGAAIETGLILGMASFILGFVGMTRPELLSSDWETFELFFLTIEPLLLGLYLAQAVLVESLVAASGFALYLNARVETEGWDLRFEFEALTQNRKKSREGKGLPIITALLFFVTALLCPAPPAACAEAPLESLEQVLDSKDFGKGDPGWQIELRHKGDSDNETIDFDALSPWLKLAQDYSAIILRIIVALAVLGLLVWFAIWWWPQRGGRGRTRSQKRLRAGSFGTREALVARDLLKEAEDAAAAGDKRRALSALRELAPLLFARTMGTQIPSNATEQDCIRHARRAFEDTAAASVTETAGLHPGSMEAEAFLGGFESIMRAWIRLAWAHRDSDDGILGKALSWSRYWSKGDTHASIK